MIDEVSGREILNRAREHAANFFVIADCCDVCGDFLKAIFLDQSQTETHKTQAN